MVKIHIQEPASSVHTFNIIIQGYTTGKWQLDLGPDLLTLFESLDFIKMPPQQFRHTEGTSCRLVFIDSVHRKL